MSQHARQGQQHQHHHCPIPSCSGTTTRMSSISAPLKTAEISHGGFTPPGTAVSVGSAARRSTGSRMTVSFSATDDGIRNLFGRYATARRKDVCNHFGSEQFQDTAIGRRAREALSDHSQRLMQCSQMLPWLDGCKRGHWHQLHLQSVMKLLARAMRNSFHVPDSRGPLLPCSMCITMPPRFAPWHLPPCRGGRMMARTITTQGWTTQCGMPCRTVMRCAAPCA